MYLLIEPSSLQRAGAPLFVKQGSGASSRFWIWVAKMVSKQDRRPCFPQQISQFKFEVWDHQLFFSPFCANGTVLTSQQSGLCIDVSVDRVTSHICSLPIPGLLDIQSVTGCVQVIFRRFPIRTRIPCHLHCGAMLTGRGPLSVTLPADSGRGRHTWVYV